MAESGEIKQVTIFGASGFVGRYVVRRMAQQGWRVRAAVRRPNEAGFLRTISGVGQVEPLFANIRDDTSTRKAIENSNAVINCVGTFDMRGKNSAEAIHVEAAERVAYWAKAHDVARFAYISSISADFESQSRYAVTKAKGEAAILALLSDAFILRPTVIFGNEDLFFNRFAKMARLGPFLPLIGAGASFQPVYVDDVARALEYAVTQDALPGIYELGGPEILSFRQLMEMMLEVICRKRIILNIPFPVAGLMARALNVAEYASFGLLKNKTLTPDQLLLLMENKAIVQTSENTLERLGVQEPTPLQAVLESYLWCYRPSGQYYKVRESFRDMESKN